MILLDGVTWARLSEAIEQLGADVSEGMVRAWASQPGAVRTMRVGRDRWYALEDLQEIEFHKRTSPRGRPRAAAI